MAIDPEIRRRLLELVYDLLDEEEAVELRASIEADPELAEAYAEAESVSRLFSEAARLETAKIELRRPERAAEARSEAVPAKPPVRPTVTPGAPWGRGANWVVGLAAAILLLISFGGYLYHRAQLADIAAGHLRLRVTGPGELHAGVANRFSVTTTSVAGTPIQSRIQFALFSPEGQQLMAHIEQTDEEGRLEITIRANQSVPDGTRLEVVAADRDRQERIDTRLRVEPVRYATQLSLDKPLYRPGETVYYRSVTLSRFGLAANREMPIQFEILDPSGAVVGGSELEGVSRRGVGCGAFQIPPGLAGGEYTLVARSLDEAFPEQRRSFFIRTYRLPRLKKELEFARDSYTSGDKVVADFSAERAEGGPAAGARLRILASVDGQIVHEDHAETSPGGFFRVEFALPDEIERGDGQLAVIVDDGGTRETIAKTIPINLGKVEVSFYPEGGDLVAGLENRVYFAARDPLGEPVHIEGRIVDGDENYIAEVETTHEGMGAFSFRPRGGETYRLEIRKPADVAAQPELPFARTDRKVVLTAGVGVFDAGEPLEFNVRAAEEGLPLVASASCRGVPVGHQAFVTERGANEVAVELDGDASGVIRLTVFDYSTSPPEPVAERLVYRRPARRLAVRVLGHGERYSPGEEVNLSLLVTDESGTPARAATLGVAVVDDALLSLADDDTPRMPTHFLLATEVENPQDLEDADFYLSDDPEAPVALDLLLGTQGWRRFVEKTLEQLRQQGREDEQITRLVALGTEASPPAVFDNLAELRTKYKRSLAAYWANRTRLLNTVTTLSFFGGLGLLLLVTMLALLNIASGVRLWAPAVVSAAACLIIGVVLMNPETTRSRPDGAVAYAPFNMAPAADEATSTEDGEPARTLPEEEEVLLRKPAEKVAAAEDEEEDGVVEQKFAVGEALLMPAALPAPGREPAAAAEEAAMAAVVDLAALDDYEELERPEAVRERMGGGGGFDGRAGMLKQHRFTVREYRHKHTPSEPGVRSDFAETLYWHPLLLTDADGRAEARFELSDSVTTFRVLVDAHASGGRIGSGEGEIISRIP